MYRKHYLPHMWEANFERLQRSDPDLFACTSSAGNELPDFARL